MNFLEKLNISLKLLQAVLFKKRFPLAVTWNITYRCNLRCSYCGAWKNKGEELDTKSIFNIIGQLAVLGTKFITFSGGEPLLKEGLGDVIEFCRNKNICVGIKSNGILVKKEIAKIKRANRIQLSLDGPQNIQDMIRGEGAHNKVIEAIETCKKEGMKVSIATVISRYNVKQISYILNIAEKYKIGVHFQPADQSLSANCDKNIRLLFGPDIKDYKKAITLLIEEKSRGNKCIDNSSAGLAHLYHWPYPQKMNCFASLIFCIIEPDGKSFICDMFPNYQKYLIPMDQSFKKSFDNLSLPHPCVGCWSGLMVEFNLLKSFKLKAVAGMWNMFKNSL